MPRTHYPHTNFTRGEWSPRVWRPDLDGYHNAVKTMENMTVLEAGGAIRRPGTRDVAATKIPAGLSVLQPFIFSTEQAYVLEFAEGFIRIYHDHAYLGVEIATPYLEEDLRGLSFEQSADVLWIVSPYYQTRTLSRYSDAIWKLAVFPDATFGVPPSYEYGERPTTTVTPSATSGAITLTAGAPQFLAADVGRLVEVFAPSASAGARALISGITSNVLVNANVIEAFAGVGAIAATDWRMGGSPAATVTPSLAGPVGASVTLTASIDSFRSSDIGKFVHVNGGVAEITGYTSALIVTGIVRAELSGVTAAAAGSWSLEEEAWSSHNGYPTSAAFYDDRLYLAGSLAQPTTVWGSVVGDYHNFAVGIADADAVQFTINTREVNRIRWLIPTRTLLAGSRGAEISISGGNDTPITPANVRARPETAFGTSESVAPVRVGNVVLSTTASDRRLRELVYSYEVDGLVGPDLLLLAEHLTSRVDGAQIVQIAYQREPVPTIWAVLANWLLCGCTYLRDQNVVAWHRHPTDGLVESVAVIPHPDGDREEVWLTVRRNQNGTGLGRIEYLDDGGHVYDTLHVDGAVTYVFTIVTQGVVPGATSGVDVAFVAGGAVFSAADVGKELRRVTLPGRALIHTFIDPTTVRAEILSDFPSSGTIPPGEWAVCPYTFTGLTHLAGAEVTGTADGGVIVPTGPVSAAGAVTFAQTGVRVEIGRAYVSTLETRDPELAQLGTLAMVPKRISKAHVRLHDTLGGELCGEELPYFIAGQTPTGSPPPLFSGIKETGTILGVSKEQTVVIRQPQPLPLTVLFVAYVLGTGA